MADLFNSGHPRSPDPTTHVRAKLTFRHSRARHVTPFQRPSPGHMRRLDFIRVQTPPFGAVRPGNLDRMKFPFAFGWLGLIFIFFPR